MAIGLEQKKVSSSSLQKVLIVLLILSAAFALFFFLGKLDLFKKTDQTGGESVPEVKKIDIDFVFLGSDAIGNLKAFPTFPSFYGSSSGLGSVEPGRENPFIPYTAGSISNEEETASKIDTESKKQ